MLTDRKNASLLAEPTTKPCGN